MALFRRRRRSRWQRFTERMPRMDPGRARLGKGTLGIAGGAAGLVAASAAASLLRSGHREGG
jgi:hypothetical protein